jgi:hypothetical protein
MAPGGWQGGIESSWESLNHSGQWGLSTQQLVDRSSVTRQYNLKNQYRVLLARSQFRVLLAESKIRPDSTVQHSFKHQFRVPLAKSQFRVLLAKSQFRRSNRFQCTNSRVFINSSRYQTKECSHGATWSNMEVLITSQCQQAQQLVGHLMISCRGLCQASLSQLMSAKKEHSKKVIRVIRGVTDPQHRR